MSYTIDVDENSIITPYFISKNGEFLGGPQDKVHNSRIMRKNKKYIDGCLSEKTIDDINVNNIIKGKYLFAGPLYSHFGHIMTESIHRLYGFRKDIFDGVVFCCASYASAGINRTEIPSFLKEILAAFGVPEEKCLLVKEPTIFECITYFEPGSNLQCGIETWYPNELKQIQHSFTRNIANKKRKLEKIFLGRSHIIDNGSIIGESYISSLLIANGFKYFAPERHSISEQVEILSKAEEIVFIEGSSIYACELLSSWNSNVMMIPRRNFDSFFKPHIDLKTNYSTIGDIGSVTRYPNHDGLIKPNSPSVIKNIDSLFSDLKENSLIKPSQTLSIEDYNEHFILDALRYSKGNRVVSDAILREYI